MGNEINTITPFSIVYDSFLARIEDSMYMEMTEVDTLEQLQSILVNAIPRFKLPRFDIFDYELGELEYLGQYTGPETDNKEGSLYTWEGGHFNSFLSLEEISILSLAMVVEWLGQQLATTELARMKYSGLNITGSL